MSKLIKFLSPIVVLIFFFCLSNSIILILIPISQYLEEKQVRLIKKGKYFN